MECIKSNNLSMLVFVKCFSVKGATWRFVQIYIDEIHEMQKRQ